MTQNNKDLHEVEDPNVNNYEPKPEGEKQFWKRHLINKQKDREGTRDSVFTGSNVGKDKSRLPRDPKSGLDDASTGNRPADQLKGEKGIKEDKMTSADKAKRETIVMAMKKKTAGFKDRYGDNYKNVMYATATKNAMEEVEDLEEDIYSIRNTKNNRTYHLSKYPITNNTRVYQQIKAKDSDAQIHKNGKPVKEEVETVIEDSQSASSDNPSMGQSTTGAVDNNNSHLNNNPTADPPSKGDVKNTLEAIAMQAAELHDKLEDGQEIDSQAQAMLSEAKDALDQVYEMVTNGGGAQDAKPAPAPKNGGASANVKEESEELEELSPTFHAAAARGAARGSPTRKGTNRFNAFSKLKMSYDPELAKRQDAERAARSKNEDFEYVDDSEELFEELFVLDEATVKDKTGTIVGTHRVGDGFKPNALGKKLGHAAHPTDVPSGTTITKRGRKVGSKSFGASKRKGETSDEAGAESEKPSFTDQLLKAADNRDGGHVEFDNGQKHHVPRVHANAGLYHLGKPEKPADKNKVRKHIGASKENFDSFRKSGGQLPKEVPAYDPDARLKARTAQITAGTKKPRSAATVALAQKILAKRKAGK